MKVRRLLHEHRVHNIICFELRVGLVCTSNGFILIANVASETEEGLAIESTEFILTVEPIHM